MGLSVFSQFYKTGGGYTGAERSTQSTLSNTPLLQHHCHHILLQGIYTLKGNVKFFWSGLKVFIYFPGLTCITGTTVRRVCLI